MHVRIKADLEQVVPSHVQVYGIRCDKKKKPFFNQCHVTPILYLHSPLPLTSKMFDRHAGDVLQFLNYTVVISFIERSQDNCNLKLAVVSVFKLRHFSMTLLKDAFHSEHCQTYLTCLMLGHSMEFRRPDNGPIVDSDRGE